MEFRMPDFFWWVDAYSEWRIECKSLWRKRFALWPTKLGTYNCRNPKYVWLGFYYSKGKKYVRSGQYPNSIFTYWQWHKVRTAQERTVN